MPKRASVPEGKALFYQAVDQSVDPPSPTPERAAPQVSQARTRPDRLPEPAQRPAAADPPRPRLASAPHTDAVSADTSVPPARRSTRQSAIFLEEYHLDWLDDRCREARRNGGRAIRKAAVIRALLDVAMEASIDLTTLQGEDEIKPRIRAALRDF